VVEKKTRKRLNKKKGGWVKGEDYVVAYITKVGEKVLGGGGFRTQVPAIKGTKVVKKEETGLFGRRDRFEELNGAVRKVLQAPF